MSDIFISYSREDQARAHVLAEALGKLGWSVWSDPDIRFGREFDEVIEEELDATRCVVVLWTGTSVESRWVKAEAGHAVKRERLIPVLLERVPPPLGFSRLQTANLVDWDGSSAAPEFRKLVSDITILLDSQSSQTGGGGQRQIEVTSGGAEEAIRGRLVDPRDFSTFVGIAYGGTESDAVDIFGEPWRRTPAGQYMSDIQLTFASSLKYSGSMHTKHPGLSVFCDDEPPHRINRIQVFRDRAWPGRYTLADPRVDCLGRTRDEVVKVMGAPDREDQLGWLDALSDFPLGYSYLEMYYDSQQAELRIVLARDQFFERKRCGAMNLNWRYSSPRPR